MKRRRTGVSFGRKLKRRRTAVGIASQALNVVQAFARTMEVKSRTIATNLLSPNTAGAIQQLDLIPLGNDATDRSGTQVTITGIGLHAQIAKHLTPDYIILRVIVYIDKRQEIDAKSTPSAFLQEVHPLSYINQLRRRRYQILLDKMVTLDKVNKGSEMLRWWKKLNITQRYNGNLGTDIESNGIFMLTMSDQGTNFPTFHFTSRIVYTDG